MYSDIDFNRNGSRKNSEKNVGFNLVRSESRRNTNGNGFEPLDNRWMIDSKTIIPNYSLMNQFEYHQSPKNNGN